MEKIDPQMAASVWQRVRGKETPEENPGVQTLIAWEKETEGVLLWLAKRLPEKNYALQQMIGDTRRHLSCLYGIRQLSGEKAGAYTPGKLNSADPGAMLRRCYGQCLRAGAQYASRSEDGQDGCVFGDMARTKRRHCALILEILGGL